MIPVASLDSVVKDYFPRSRFWEEGFGFKSQWAEKSV